MSKYNESKIFIYFLAILAFLMVIFSISKYDETKKITELRECFINFDDVSNLSRKSLKSYEKALFSLLADTNVTVKLTSIQLLGKINSEAAQEKLLDLTDSNENRVRFFSVEALGLTKNKFPEKKVLQIYLHDPSAQVRAQAAVALARSGGDITKEFFTSTIDTSDVASENRIFAPIVLYQITGKTTYFDRINLVLNDQSIPLGNRLIGIFSMILSDDRAFDEIFKTLCNDPNEKIRNMVNQAFEN